MIEAYPLQWPLGFPRTTQRVYGRFKTNFAKARDNIRKQVRMLGGDNVIISTNIPLRRDGFPMSRGMSRGSDTAVAVYFTLNNEQRVVACDKYHDIDDNIHAIALTLEAMRGIDRWGASDILNRAFAGMKALPPPEKDWWDVLGVHPRDVKDVIKSAWRRLVMQHHPDNDGNPDTFMQVNNAWETYKKLYNVKD